MIGLGGWDQRRGMRFGRHRFDYDGINAAMMMPRPRCCKCKSAFSTLVLKIPPQFDGKYGEGKLPLGDFRKTEVDE